MHTLPISKFCLIRRYSEAEAWERTLLIPELQCLSKRRQRSAHCSVSSSNSRFGNCKQTYASCLQLTNLLNWPYPAHCGAIPGPWTCWGMWEWNFQQARKGGTTQNFKGPEPSLGRISIIRSNAGWIISVWQGGVVLVVLTDRLENWFQALAHLQRPDYCLLFKRTQSRVVTGLLTRHNTLRRHLYMTGLSNNPACRKCGMEEETSLHVLCVRPWLHSDIHIWVPSFWTLRMLRI